MSDLFLFYSGWALKVFYCKPPSTFLHVFWCCFWLFLTVSNSLTSSLDLWTGHFDMWMLEELGTSYYTAASSKLNKCYWLYISGTYVRAPHTHTPLCLNNFSQHYTWNIHLDTVLNPRISACCPTWPEPLTNNTLTYTHPLRLMLF